jgi:hypothetical protein
MKNNEDFMLIYYFSLIVMVFILGIVLGGVIKCNI